MNLGRMKVMTGLEYISTNTLVPNEKEFPRRCRQRVWGRMGSEEGGVGGAGPTE